MKGTLGNLSTVNRIVKFETTASAVALILLVHVLAGCASGESSAKTAKVGKYYAVTSEKAAFYKYGPQQGSGADLELPKDTLLTLIRSSFGYCKVTLTSGEQGFVAREDINVAPPNLVAAVTNPSGGGAHGEQFNINSNDPRLIAPPEALPDSSPVMPVEPDPLQQQ
ncbi:MAG: hypothetical protein ABJB22_04015 [Verrucomicrobiota bacterium]